MKNICEQVFWSPHNIFATSFISSVIEERAYSDDVVSKDRVVLVKWLNDGLQMEKVEKVMGISLKGGIIKRRDASKLVGQKSPNWL